MKQKKQEYDCPNCIEEKARKMFGYDDASLEAEMEEAERAWEAEKSANPEASDKIQLEADEGFDKLMAKIRERGIEPISEEEYQEAEQKNIRKEIRLGRKGKKALVLAAVVCVMALGMTMVVSARREFKYRTYPVQGKQNKIIIRNNILVTKGDSIEAAYEEIENTLEIKVLRLGHIPEKMNFKQILVYENHAVIELECEGQIVYFKESKMPIQSGVTGALLSDRKSCEEVYNMWLDKALFIEENILDDGIREYSVNIDMENFYYYISGMIDKDDFVEIVKGITY